MSESRELGGGAVAPIGATVDEGGARVYALIMVVHCTSLLLAAYTLHGNVAP